MPARCPVTSKSVTGPIPRSPRAIRGHASATDPPTAQTRPCPVIATRKLPRGVGARGAVRFAAVVDDPARECAHRSEGDAPLRPLGDAHTELLFDRHRQLQRIERVETETLAEERRVVVDRRGITPLEVELADDEE
jgi:hypothetical protein